MSQHRKVVVTISGLLVALFWSMSDARAAASLQCVTRVENYESGTLQFFCEDGYTVVAASCDAGINLVTQSQFPSPPSGGVWVSYLLPNADNATGVQCNLPGISTQTQVHLRCCRVVTTTATTTGTQ